MVCINSSYIGWTGFRNAILVSLLVPLFLFSGCSSQPKKAHSDLSEVSDESSGERPKIELIPNPYLTQKAQIPNEAVTPFRDALIAIQSEDWDVAEQQLTVLTQTYAHLSGPWVNLGIVYWRQNQLEKAEEAFKQALLVNELNNDAYVQYAFFLREQGRFAEAETIYQKALEVWPHNAAAHRNLGILYDLYMGKFDNAFQHYEMVLQLSAEPNKEVEGWVIDLKRRQAASARQE